MRKEFIFVLVSLLAVGLIVQCGGSSSSVDLPDLAGTWEGTAWVDTNAFDIPVTPTNLSDRAEPQITPTCTGDGFTTVVLLTDEGGNPTDLLLCGESIASMLETGITGEVDEADIDNNVVWVEFSYESTGEFLYYGGLFLDDSLDYALFMLWDDKDNDIAIAGLQNYPTGMTDYSESALAGDWSGFAIAIDDFEWTWEKAAPVDVTLTEDNSLSVLGSDPDGNTITGTVNVQDPDYGYVYGNLDVMETPYGLDGVQSPDGEFFGAAMWTESDEWIVIMVRRQEVVF